MLKKALQKKQDEGRSEQERQAAVIQQQFDGLYSDIERVLAKQRTNKAALQRALVKVGEAEALGAGDQKDLATLKTQIEQAIAVIEQKERKKAAAERLEKQRKAAEEAARLKAEEEECKADEEAASQEDGGGPTVVQPVKSAQQLEFEKAFDDWWDAEIKSTDINAWIKLAGGWITLVDQDGNREWLLRKTESLLVAFSINKFRFALSGTHSECMAFSHCIHCGLQI